MIQTIPKQIVPDQLKITIRTNIPGYQSVEYKPHMSNPEIESNEVYFDPFVKLNNNVVKKMPAEYRMKQFFNKGLFDSLKTYAGEKPLTSLAQATYVGYVDNNIRVTLNTLFEPNSVITIGNNPYTIGDVRWSTGDWKIEAKQKKQDIDLSKLNDPRLYSELIKEEIIKSDEQLKALPLSATIGNNYSGEISKKRPTTNEPPLVQKPPTAANEPPYSTPTPVPTPNPTPTSTPVPPTLNPTPMPTPTSSSPSPALPSSTELIQTTNEPMYELPIHNESTNQYVTPEQEKVFERMKDVYTINQNSTNEFSNYFVDNSYYTIVNNIYLNMQPHIKEQIVKFYRWVTQSKWEKYGKNLSKIMYDKLCKQVNIIKSPADGNCFFSAVAYGINIHNYNNNNDADKIYYQQYGKTQPFTIRLLREIVLRYYETINESTKETLKIVGLSNVERLNELFKSSIETHPVSSNEEYMERLNVIYKSDDNFFVFKPTVKSIFVDDEFAPFKLISDSQVASYIRSNDYWGDQLAIQAICNMLHIYIIPIDFAKKAESVTLLAALSEPDTIKNICSKNTMFLYRKNIHYELIKFVYKEQFISKKDKTYKIANRNYTIFKSNLSFPPFHILLLIYGSYYITSDMSMKSNFGIYRSYMRSIHNSVKIICNNPSIENYQTFITTFNQLFRLNKSLCDYVIDTDVTSNALILKGGAIPMQSSASKLAYAITIELELYPGTSLTSKQLQDLKCTSKYNAIRKAYSELTNTPYKIQPNYAITKSSITKKKGGSRPRKHTRKL